jgi:hypothetical protein
LIKSGFARPCVGRCASRTGKSRETETVVNYGTVTIGSRWKTIESRDVSAAKLVDGTKSAGPYWYSALIAPQVLVFVGNMHHPPHGYARRSKTYVGTRHTPSDP